MDMSSCSETVFQLFDVLWKKGDFFLYRLQGLPTTQSSLAAYLGKFPKRHSMSGVCGSQFPIFLRARGAIKPSLFLRFFAHFGFFFPPVFPKPALKLEPAWGAGSMS